MADRFPHRLDKPVQGSRREAKRKTVGNSRMLKKKKKYKSVMPKREGQHPDVQLYKPGGRRSCGSPYRLNFLSLCN